MGVYVAHCVETNPPETTPYSKRPSAFGLVDYDESAHFAGAWVVTVVAIFLMAGAWIFVGPSSGVAATVGCAVVCAATWLLRRPVALRIAAVLLAFFLPLGLVVPQILVNNRMAAEAEVRRIAAEKPYADAVVAAKAGLETQGFAVNTLSLNRSDMTRGEAELTFHVGRTKYAKVILIKKDDRWTVNCPTATGEPVDINTDGYEVGKLMHIAGRCPAGYQPKSTPTPTP